MFYAKIETVLALLSEQPTKPVQLVAIDGHSAAGKSTLARTLSALLPNVTIIHTDDFYRTLDERERAALDAEGGYYRYYDWERLEAQVLQPLSSSETSCYQKYDWSTNSLGEWVTVPAAGIILIEGCYAARPELRYYYDILLFVATPPVQRLQRQSARADATAAWLARWDAAEQFYMAHYQPHRYAHLVIAGE